MDLATTALRECEAVIESSMENAGMALRRIKADKLYRVEFSTFEDYCQTRWNMTRVHTNRMLEHQRVNELLEPMGSLLPTGERQTRPLGAIPDADKATVWNDAVEMAGGTVPTAAIVTEAVEAVTKPRREQSSDHPATFSVRHIQAFNEVLAGYAVTRICDPFAGVGKVHELAWDTVGIEIEPEWAAKHARTICGDSRTVQVPGGFDAVVTSPTYGNRMADKHTATDNSDRATYKHRLGRDLTEGSTAGSQWGDDYRALHVDVYSNIVGQLAPGGVFVLNIKDHVRNGRRVPVSIWHVNTLLSMGLVLQDDAGFESAGLGSVGANRETHVGIEHVYVFTHYGR